jgi:nucleoside-diphosphate-sugar epimerase
VKYFLTGATGFIGGRIARQLVAGGHRVSALVRAPEKAAALAALGVEVHLGDITARDTLIAPMRGADGVFHVAGWYRIGARDPAPAWRINVEGTRNVLDVMRELGVPRGVYTSTLAVFGDTRGRLPDESFLRPGPHLTIYDRTKWTAHHEIAAPMMRAGLPLVIVQPGLVYGPGDTSGAHDTWVRYLRRRLPLVPLVTAYCWAHVEDVARGHVLAMERGRAGESYIIAGPPHTLAEALEIAERITGVPAPRLRVPPGPLKAAARLARWVERVFPLPAGYTAEDLEVMAGVTYLGSNAKAARELGYAPRSLEEGLRETLLEELRRLGLSGR